MSVSIAALRIEVDATSATAAEGALDKLTAASARVDGQNAKNTKSAKALADAHAPMLALLQRETQAAGGYASAKATMAKAMGGAASAAKIEADLYARNQALRSSLLIKEMADEARATKAAETASQQRIAAEERLQATMAKRNSGLQGSLAIAAMREEAAAVTSLEARMDRLLNSIDPTRAAQARLNAEMQEASSLFKMGAISASDYAKATSVLDERLAAAARGQDRMNGLHATGAGSSRAMTQATLNLGRQFADVGVQAAMLTNPLMILIMQGPQIADAFATAKAQGLGFKAVLAGMAASAAPILAVLAPVIAVAAAAAAGFALLHRELSMSYPTDVTDGLKLTTEQMRRVTNELGLTERQIADLKDTTVHFGDTFMATFTVIGRHIMEGPLGAAFDWLGGKIGGVLDATVKATVTAVATVVGIWGGATKTIGDHWSDLPRIVGSAVSGAVNSTISFIEKMVNAAIGGLNAVVGVANKIPGVNLGTAGPVKLGRVQEVAAPSLASIGADLSSNVANSTASARKGMSDFADEIAAEAVARAVRRVTANAGYPNPATKGPATPRDQTSERSSQVEAMLAQAKADELQAQLGVTREIQARADLEKQIGHQQALAKQAQVDRQIARIEDDKGLSAAKKAELTAQLQTVKAINDRIEVAKNRAIDEAAADALAKEALNRQTAAAELQIDVLSSQGAVAKYAYQRRDIDMKVLKLQQQIERLKLEEVVHSSASTQAEKDIAAARLAALGAIQGNQQKAADGGLDGAFNNVKNALDGMASAFKNQDWKGVLTGLIEAIGSLRAAFGPTGTLGGKIGAVSAVAGAVGQAVGGVAGSALSGLAGGAMAGFTVAGPIGAAIGAVVGGIAGWFTGNKAKKQAEEAARQAAAEREAQRQTDILNQRRQIELNIIGLSGDAVATLAAQRKAELSGIDASNLALMDQLYAAQDAKRRTDERTALEIRYMQATGDQAGILAKQRAEEVKGIDATNRALLDLVYAQEDYASAQADYATNLADYNSRLADARSAASAAYEREASALQATKDKFTALARTIRDFSDSLTDASASPEQSYRSTKAKFLATASSSDPDVLSGFGASAQAFLTASQANSRTAAEYRRDQMLVQNAARAAEATATRQVSVADQQLDAIKAQVSGLGILNESVLSLPAAIAALLAIQTAAPIAPTAPSGPTGLPVPTVPSAQTPDWASYLSHYPDVMAWAQSGHGDPGRPIAQQSLEDRGRYHYYNSGQGEGRTPFATGGSFTVGGSGGTDSQAFGPLRLTPGEVGNITRRDVMESLLGEISALRQEVSQLRSEQRSDLSKIEVNTGKIESTLTNVTEGGRVMLTEAAA